MTVILQGDRIYALMVAADRTPIDCADSGLATSNAFECRWRQISLKPKPLIFLNPPKPVGISPRDTHWVFLDKISIDWSKWISKYSVPVKSFENPTPVQLVSLLTKGTQGITFDSDAAQFYVDCVGCSMARLSNELFKLKLTGIQQVSLDTLAQTAVGKVGMVAKVIASKLGTTECLALAAKVIPTDAYGLICYLKNYLSRAKNGWGIILQKYDDAFMKKKIDTPWMMLQLFVHHCLHAPKGAEFSAVIESLDLTGEIRWLLPYES